MKIRNSLFRASALLALVTSAALADHVTVDYDHHVAFGNYHTYSWGKVETANSIWDSRVKDAINQQLAAKGWTEVTFGGEVTLVGVETTHIKPQLNTFYDGFGGWRWGGFGDATTTVQNYKIGTRIVDIFDTNSKNLVWRGNSSGTLSGSPDRNAKELDKDVQKMFEHFPPQASS